jgi:uncharacterized protein (DUF2062 family)
MSRLRRLAQILLHVEDTPTRVALAFGLGIFIAFFPIFGIHTAMAIGLAFAFRLNRAAILAGTFTNNPWTIAPMYTTGTLLGCSLLGVSPISLGEVAWHLHGRAFYDSLIAGLGPLVMPYIVGNLVLGLVTGTLAFAILRFLLWRRRGPAA